MRSWLVGSGGPGDDDGEAEGLKTDADEPDPRTWYEHDGLREPDDPCDMVLCGTSPNDDPWGTDRLVS